MNTVYLDGQDQPAGPTRLNQTIFTDESLYDREMQAIFTKGWVYVAHESQVSKPGDYLTTSIGATPVIVMRDDNGELHIFVNRCLHRGMTLCHENRGNANFLRCPYHGWTYRNSGAVAGVTFPVGYGSEQKELRGSSLQEVAEFDSHAGFMFARLEGEGVSLAEHLGAAAEYLSRVAEPVGGHPVVVDPVPYRHDYRGNWKLQVENTVDSYHAGVVHRSFFEVVAARSGRDVNDNPFMHDDSPIRTVDLGGGHGLMTLANTRTSTNEAGNGGGDSYLARAYTSPDGAEVLDALTDRLGAARVAELVEPTTDFNLIVFPNLMIVQSQIRVVFPVDVETTRVEAYVAVLDGGPDEVNELRRRVVERFWGPCGFGTPDDVEMFERFQKTANADLPQWLMISRGVEREERIGEIATSRGSDEGQIRSFYRQWGSVISRSYDEAEVIA